PLATGATLPGAGFDAPDCAISRAKGSGAVVSRSDAGFREHPTRRLGKLDPCTGRGRNLDPHAVQASTAIQDGDEIFGCAAFRHGDAHYHRVIGSNRRGFRGPRGAIAWNRSGWWSDRERRLSILSTRPPRHRQADSSV